MLIDWFTVAAQVLNFLILVWLLKRFLYRPILDAIDARETKIATELADADAKRAEARKERDTYQTKNDAFDQQRAALLSKVNDDADAERKRLFDAARKAADSLSAKREESLRDAMKNFNDALHRKTQEEVFAIARQTLTDLADVDLQDRIGAVFIRRLRAMEGQAKSAMADAMAAAKAPALVRSAFDLPTEQRAAIQKALDETFGEQTRLRFETTPDIVGGIELSVNGQKLGWSIAEYLKSLEKSVAMLLKPQPESETVSP
jgi:F-type H+-transporting ATPase subunit b